MAGYHGPLLGPTGHSLSGVLHLWAAIVLMFIIMGALYSYWNFLRVRIIPRDDEEGSLECEAMNRNDCQWCRACVANGSGCVSNIPAHIHPLPNEDSRDSNRMVSEYAPPATPSMEVCQVNYRSFPKRANFPGTPAALDKITRLIKATCKLSVSSTAGKCGLCGQEIYEGDFIRTLPCYHKYHDSCILQLLLVARATCPDCDNGEQLY